MSMVFRELAPHFACIEFLLMISINALDNFNNIWTQICKKLWKKRLLSYLVLESFILSQIIIGLAR